jgi:F0F1-type ATP synthase epsilon subunit
MFLEVSLLSPQRAIFEGRAKSVILPGEQGVFEIRPFHKRIISRLIRGKLFIDEKAFEVKRGIARVSQNKVTVIIEEWIET